jgi:Tfp pilus assembly protein FimT
MRGMRGTTLPELIVALGVAAVVGAIAVAGFVELVQSARVAGAARALAAGLRAARGRALAGDGPVEVRFDAGGGRWTVLDGGGVPVTARALPATVAFTALPARARVRFTRIGTADNATVALAAGGRVRQVVVNQRGRVRLQ